MVEMLMVKEPMNKGPVVGIQWWRGNCGGGTGGGPSVGGGQY